MRTEGGQNNVVGARREVGVVQLVRGVSGGPRFDRGVNVEGASTFISSGSGGVAASDRMWRSNEEEEEVLALLFAVYVV